MQVTFLHSVRHLMLIDICMKFREDSLRGFQVTERTRFVTDRRTGQMEGRTDARGKTICQPILKGGRHNLILKYKKGSRSIYEKHGGCLLYWFVYTVVYLLKRSLLWINSLVLVQSTNQIGTVYW